jgi:hypothetical protein
LARGAAGHLDVGKQQFYVRTALENSERGIGIDCFNRSEPCILNEVYRAHA